MAFPSDAIHRRCHSAQTSISRLSILAESTTFQLLKFLLRSELSSIVERRIPLSRKSVIHSANLLDARVDSLQAGLLNPIVALPSNQGRELFVISLAMDPKLATRVDATQVSRLLSTDAELCLAN